MLKDKKLNPILKQILIELILISNRPIDKLRHELNHILNVLEWIYKLKPNPKITLQIAALLHDCDRFIERKRIKKEKFDNYEEYKKIHSKISAEIASKILDKINQSHLKPKIKELIKKHEVGGTPLSDILMRADSLSFFDRNILDYFRWNGIKKTKNKIKFMYNRLDKKSKKLLKEINLDFKKIPKLNQLFKKL